MREWVDDYRNKAVVFGVCHALARRAGLATWGMRLGAFVMLLLWSVPTLLVYLVLALLLPETRRDTVKGLRQFGAWCREVGGKLIRLLRLWLQPPADAPPR